MKAIRSYTLVLASIVLLTACEEEYEPETIPAYELAGEWFVRTYTTVAEPDSLAVDYVRILTSNTAAAEGDKIWIDDEGNLPSVIGFKVKVPANPENLSFSGTNLYSAYNDTVTVSDSVYVNILEGRVFEDEGRGLVSNTVVDSIYIRYTISSFPGTELILAGHYRTGFTEDEI